MADIRKLIALSALFHLALFAALGPLLPGAVTALQEITPVELVELPETEEPRRAAPAPVKARPVIEKMIEAAPARPLPKAEPEAVREAGGEVVKAAPEAPVMAERKAEPVTAAAIERPPVAPAIAREPARPEAALDNTAAFVSYVIQKIDRAKLYPNWARQRGYEGSVLVRFRVLPDGSVRDVAVVRQCASEILNRAACEAVERAAPFSNGPLRPDGERVMEVSIGFRLKK